MSDQYDCINCGDCCSNYSDCSDCSNCNAEKDWKHTTKLIIKIILGIGISVCIIALGLYFGGYVLHNHYNNNLITTTCTVIGYLVEPFVQTFACPCSTIGLDCVNNSTCYEITNKLYYNVSYPVMENVLTTFTSSVYYGLEQDNATAYAVLMINEPLDSSFTCYFQEDSPYTIILFQEDAISYEIAAGVFFGLSGLLFLSMLPILGYYKWKKSKEVGGGGANMSPV